MNNFDMRNDKIAHLRKVINVKFAVSYFVPVIIKDVLVDVAFIYSAITGSKARTRPFAKVMFEHNGSGLIEYKNSFIDDFMDSEKYPITTEVDYSFPADVSVRELGENMKKVNSCYDEICELAYKTELSDEEKAKVCEYKDLFIKSTPEALMPYYEALSPEFFEWLNNI